ncbi:acyl-CoA carboxylase epsilon subunit [Phytomonospora endophytica]|uniref:Acyl-CoA carboxylase subunit epsilon n=1 Tax=Phytomonospora endophytica TaxID=714109 RepID=A0A841FI79_9ACTN|nr:acyl-CoA carboxylase epsilon subunit [Phytomonospora endophytica]MBB6033282.1 hypothetical protein [Phytomonospora endophytica]GIG65508.1 hypothetical protein Pen01_18030 [Phytomonospora endophytica]
MQVVRGEVTPEELAALYVVLAAKANAGTAAPPPPALPWSDPGLRLGAVRDWRSSGLPR